jgi:FlaA1/EpsC-like NDP-sugar epimerase
VLDMGQPVRIADLALRMVELSGLSVRDEANPEGDIALQVTGLRPGEKLYEELLIGDNPQPTQHKRMVPGYTPADAVVDWVSLARANGPRLETL